MVIFKRKKPAPVATAPEISATMTVEECVNSERRMLGFVAQALTSSGSADIATILQDALRAEHDPKLNVLSLVGQAYATRDCGHKGWVADETFTTGEVTGGAPVVAGDTKMNTTGVIPAVQKTTEAEDTAAPAFNEVAKEPAQGHADHTCTLLFGAIILLQANRRHTAAWLSGFDCAARAVTDAVPAYAKNIEQERLLFHVTR